MKSQILFSQIEVTTWVFTHLPRCTQDILSLRPNSCVSLGFTRYGKLSGGVVWYNLAKDRSNVECALYAEGRFLTRQAALTIVRVPFDVFGVAHVTGFTRDDNEACIRIFRRGCWQLEGIQRKAFDGVHDCLVYGLTREDADLAIKKLWR